MHAFPKSLRLRHRTEFKRTLDDGQKTVCRELVLFGRVRSEGDAVQAEGDSGFAPRLGLIVSKKVGNAVVRNHVKRCFREAFRRLQPELATHDAFKRLDLVIIARGDAAALTGDRALGALRHCLARFAKRTKTHERSR